MGARGLHLHAAQAARKAFLEVPDIVRDMGRGTRRAHVHVQLRSDSLRNGYYAITRPVAGAEHMGAAIDTGPPARARRARAGGG